jgi:hypothetical protein
MASVGHGHYVVVVLHVGGSKASDINQVLQREPRAVKHGFLSVRSCLTKSVLMPLFASYLRKLALF